jgi:dGTPase
LNEKLGVLRALAIGQLLEESVALFLDEEKSILDGKFDQALTDEIVSKNALKEISKISVEKIYRARTVVEIEASGHAVLPGLLEEFVVAAQSLQQNTASRKHKNLQLLLPEEIRWALTNQAETPNQMLRLIVDFISGLTDRHALSLYRKIKGISYA